jgi:hypothetical protein
MHLCLLVLVSALDRDVLLSGGVATGFAYSVTTHFALFQTALLNHLLGTLPSWFIGIPAVRSHTLGALNPKP